MWFSGEPLKPRKAGYGPLACWPYREKQDMVFWSVDPAEFTNMNSDKNKVLLFTEKRNTPRKHSQISNQMGGVYIWKKLHLRGQIYQKLSPPSTHLNLKESAGFVPVASSLPDYCSSLQFPSSLLTTPTDWRTRPQTSNWNHHPAFLSWRSEGLQLCSLPGLLAGPHPCQTLGLDSPLILQTRQEPAILMLHAWLADLLGNPLLQLPLFSWWRRKWHLLVPFSPGLPKTPSNPWALRLLISRL